MIEIKRNEVNYWQEGQIKEVLALLIKKKRLLIRLCIINLFFMIVIGFTCALLWYFNNGINVYVIINFMYVLVQGFLFNKNIRAYHAEQPSLNTSIANCKNALK